jgi:hypothetical protein
VWYEDRTGKKETRFFFFGCQRGDRCINTFSYSSSLDGIFLNYNWTPEGAEKSAVLADQRPLDVYVGTDVFGRGTYGGGGYDSFKGIRTAFSKGASAAIFAPGWTLECEAATGDDFLFELAEARLWDGKKLEKMEVAREGFTIQKNGGVGWGLSTDSVLPGGDKCSITSSDWCTRFQVIDLLSCGYVPLSLAEDVPDIIVSVKFKGTPPNCADLFHLVVELRDKEHRVLAK